MKMTAGILLFLLSACGMRTPSTTGSDDVYSPKAATGEKSVSAAFRTAAGEPKLIRIYFNPYTDSIKPVLNYYINVEGEYSDGTFLPLDKNSIRLSSDVGTIEGNEWVIKPPVPWKKVTFYAEALNNPALKATLTQYVMQGRSEEDERIMRGRQTNGRD